MREQLDVELDKSNVKGNTGGTLRFTDYGCWGSRNAATMHLLIEALRPIQKQKLRSFKMEIYTGDKPRDDMSFAYCKRDDQRVTAIPDYIFWDWPETAVYDYPTLVQQMIRASAIPPTSDKLFWIGNLSTNLTRQELMRLANGRQDMQIEAMTWTNSNAALPSETKLAHSGNFYTMPQHCQFKYLLDMQGNGHSGRLKMLLFSGRPVLVQGRKWKEYFHNWLVPFEHYIPVEESLRDLSAKLEWARSHEEECKRIGAAGQSFALQHLTRDSAMKYLRGILLERFPWTTS